jgi:hypothetical protein
MPSNIAKRRAAKAARRKKVLAERRQADVSVGSSKVEQVRRLAALPVDRCLLQTGLFETGMGMLILTRKLPTGGLAMANFLLDSYCLGVKGAFFKLTDRSEVDYMVKALEVQDPFREVELPYARKLLRDLVAYGRQNGFEPDRDFAAAELLFGDASADASDATFTFGLEGRPVYVPGPDEPPSKTRQRLETLRRHLGDDGFELMDALAEADDDDFFEEASDYDPNVAPDPDEWLALDEEERLSAISAYHREAGIEVPNERAHALFHVLVENQIAMGDEVPVVGRTVQRLMEQDGLDRHEAIHAVASVASAQMFDAMKSEGGFDKEKYAAELERLTAERWRKWLEENGDAP